jgi:predicted SAM-dependent methyltransferase
VTLKLHLGCGEVKLPGFVNIDIRSTPATDMVADIRNLSTFPSHNADVVYASHCLEHFGFREVDSVLKEWCRVLRKSGDLFIAVPDFDKLVAAYSRHFTLNILHTRIHNHKLTSELLGDILGGQDYPENVHKCLFNEASIKERLEATGFCEIKRVKPPPWASNGATAHYASMFIHARKKEIGLR